MKGTFLSFDYGEKRIGAAVGDASIGVANPLTVIANRSGTPDWQTIDGLVEQWQPIGLVVGVPLQLSGEEQPMSHAARGFIKQCRKRFELTVHEADERLSSMEASDEIRQMRQTGQRKRKTVRSDLDTLSAALILERWFRDN